MMTAYAVSLNFGCSLYGYSCSEHVAASQKRKTKPSQGKDHLYKRTPFRYPDNDNPWQKHGVAHEKAKFLIKLHNLIRWKTGLHVSSVMLSVCCFVSTPQDVSNFDMLPFTIFQKLTHQPLLACEGYMYRVIPQAIYSNLSQLLDFPNWPAISMTRWDV